MKKNGTCLVLLAAALVLSGCVMTASGTTRKPHPAPVKKVHSPPVVVVGEDPELIVIPGTYVYWLSGSWVVVESRHVPTSVSHLPPGWRQKHHDSPRVRWHETRQNWKSWEHDKHWEKRKWKNNPHGRN